MHLLATMRWFYVMLLHLEWLESLVVGSSVVQCTIPSFSLVNIYKVGKCIGSNSSKHGSELYICVVYSGFSVV